MNPPPTRRPRPSLPWASLLSFLLLLHDVITLPFSFLHRCDAGIAPFTAVSDTISFVPIAM